MTTAATAANNIRDTAKDAREKSPESDLQSDLQALRDDFARLAEQVGDILAGKGDAAW